jgi:hypothetical protein
VKYHPASLMLRVWVICILAYIILPFQMESRVLTAYGFGILALFIAFFCGGALFASGPMVQQPRSNDLRVNFGVADRVLRIAAVITVLAFAVDLVGGGNFDLASSYADRSDRANNLLIGAASDSSSAFQVGFLFYPASYIFILREIGFEQRPRIHRVVLYGLIPVLMATLAMGGRAPLAYAIILVAYGFAVRRQIFDTVQSRLIKLPSGRAGFGMKILLGASGLLAMSYFVQVFFVRAESAGGVQGMFDVARSSWGVTFNGYLSGFFFSVFGEEYTYLIFIFTWYLVQGLVMSNVLFTDYAGPANLGIYGVDLVAALMRRLDGDFVADRFGALLQLNTYGFLPSAFGSLYVDFFFFGLLACALWGWASGFVYRRVKEAADPRWLLLAPFVSLGVFFSLINTPIGFSNGLVTHSWLLLVFLLSKKMVRVQPTPSLPSLSPVTAS